MKSKAKPPVINKDTSVRVALSNHTNKKVNPRTTRPSKVVL